MKVRGHGLWQALLQRKAVKGRKGARSTMSEWIAGEREKGDCRVTVEEGEEGIQLILTSSVIGQYEKQIRHVIFKTLECMGITNLNIRVEDKGALDCILQARVEGAVYRMRNKTENIPWEGLDWKQEERNRGKEGKNEEKVAGERNCRGTEEKKTRLRRTMMFVNAQKPTLLKDPWIYGEDCVILDLEDGVAEGQKDAARFTLFHTLREMDYRDCERIVRINGLDTPYWKEDIRCAVAGGCDAIRIPKTESAEEVCTVEKEIERAEKEFGREPGSVLIMAAVESARGVVKALEICEASRRLFGIALSGGDYTRDLHTHITGTGVELQGARENLVIAARAAGVQCFDTVYTDLDNQEGFQKETQTIHLMGFDGKSIIHPGQIRLVHEIFTPTEKEIVFAEKVVEEIEEKRAQGIGVFTVDGKMIDIAFYDGAKRVLKLAKAAGIY